MPAKVLPAFLTVTLLIVQVKSFASVLPEDPGPANFNVKNINTTTGKSSFPFVFRISRGPTGQAGKTMLRKVCQERGWTEFDAENNNNTGENALKWDLWWRSSDDIRTAPNISIQSWQYLNNILKTIDICEKDGLANYIRDMQGRFGNVFNFCPTTFLLPRDRDALEKEHKKRSNPAIVSSAQNLVPFNSREDNGTIHGHQVKPLWICKAVGKDRGEGISLIDNLSNLPDYPATIVQEYISKPLLISGHKLELRLYVSIVSISPLTVYAYREGFTRFATDVYDLSSLDNRFSHLTNVAINSKSPNLTLDKSVIGPGCLWTLQNLRGYLQENGLSDWLLWQRILGILVLTVLSQVEQKAENPSIGTNFDFTGFDILIDSNLRPWLVEVNSSPGLMDNFPVEQVVRKPMVKEFFSLMRLPDGPGVDPASGLRGESINWHDAPSEYGDWIRIFPFDDLSWQMTRGQSVTDVRAMVNDLEEYLNFAENIFREHPGNSDEYYNDRMSEKFKWNTTLWIPRQ